MTMKTLSMLAWLVLLAAGEIGASEIRSVADLKADLGLADRRVLASDLGLRDKEVLAPRLFDAPLVIGKYAFDEKMLMMAIEGMINRNGPLVFLDLIPSGWSGYVTWWKYYGKTRGFRFIGRDQDFAAFLRQTAPVFNGIILYDWHHRSYGFDKTGPMAGVPYDAWQTKAYGKGKWWEGYDPADLYVHHFLPWDNLDVIHHKMVRTSRGDWINDRDVLDAQGKVVGTVKTDPEAQAKFIRNWYLRTKDLIDKYHPEVLYFDWGLPFSHLPCLDACYLRLQAHYYNSSMKWNDGAGPAEAACRAGRC